MGLITSRLPTQPGPHPVGLVFGLVRTLHAGPWKSPARFDQVDRSSRQAEGAGRPGSRSCRSAAKWGADLTPRDALA